MPYVICMLDSFSTSHYHLAIQIEIIGHPNNFGNFVIWVISGTVMIWKKLQKAMELADELLDNFLLQLYSAGIRVAQFGSFLLINEYLLKRN